ncbi:MAG: hypothetical protein AB1468_02025 [Candidatus Micrarchaeota archaeon]
MGRPFALFIVILALASAVGLARAELVKYVNVVEPVVRTMHESDEPVEFGVVGPGQTVYIVADPRVPESGGGWDQLEITKLPEGWSTEPSLLFERPMKALIKAAPDADDGTYDVSFRAVDAYNGDYLGNMSFSGKVRVSRDVMEMSVSPLEARTGVGQPAGYFVTIKNKGVASDLFEVSVEGLPTWKYRKTVYVPYGMPYGISKTVEYEIAGDEERDAELKVVVTSTSSPLIRAESSVKLHIQTNLISDFRAAGHGLLMFPVIEQPIYSLLGFISNLLG